MPQEMQKQFDVHIPTFQEYAQASAQKFAHYFNSKSHKPTLIIEPGTALSANAMQYVTKIVTIKHVKERTIATLSGSSYNINPNPNRKNSPLKIFHQGKTDFHNNIYFAGYTCIEGDYLYKNYKGEIGVGDYVVFSEIGSYSIVMKPPFIKPNVAIVQLVGNDYKVLKKPETFEDIFHTYTLIDESNYA
jgi:diaminopimelate decarboxylase